MSGVLVQPHLVRQQATDEALATLSVQQRTAGDRGGGRPPGAAAAHLDDQLAGIDVVAPSSVTLSSADGTLGATVVNGLDQPVTVQVRAETDGSLEVDDSGVLRLGPGDRSRLLLDVNASRLGIHQVRLLVTDQDGTPLGGAAALPVRSAQVSAIIWYILVFGAVLLFGTILVRVVRQVRARRRDVTATAVAPPVRGPGGRRPGRRRPPPGRAGGDHVSDTKLLSATAVMAAGTILSRFSGLFRTLLIVAALGQALHADIFTIANTIPNAVYILVAGGVFNAVLVPQLVRSMKNDPDGGDAYAARIITLSAIFLAVVTVILVLAAPWLVRIYLSDEYYRPDRTAQLDSAIAFTRYCLPQVFFYGMFVLVGQVLNARQRFGPMMWAPIANNLVAIAVLGGYLLVWGTPTAAEQVGPYSHVQELVLGLGSTLGIVVQFLILVPYLRRAGFSYRPRFDFRGTGLGHTLRLGVWTVLFVVVNQIAYIVVTRLASSGTVNGGGTGNTVYSSSFLIMMVPHAIITVSLTTAILPRLSGYATDARLGDMGRTLGSTLRTALVVVLPFAALVPILASDIAGVLFNTGAGDPARVRSHAGGLRAGAGVLHRPLHDAARLLRPRADPARLLHPVRDLGHQHRGRACCWSAGPRPTRPRPPSCWPG